MELKPGYKQTEVGVIPEDWDVKRLKEISPSQSVGLVINPSSYFETNGEVPMLVGSCISENKINAEKASRISRRNSERLSACRLKTGDLVTVRVGFPGTTAVVPTELDGCNCASMMIIRGHKSFDSYWLAQLLNSPIGRQQIENVEYRTAQKQFNISDAINFSFSVPPPAEQIKIAEAAKNFDEYIESIEQKIDKKRQIKQAAMQELLTGKRRLPGFEGEWEVKTLRQVAMIRSGITKNSCSKIQNPVKVNYLRVANVQDGFFDLSEISKIEILRHEVAKYSVLAGDVLMNEGGDLDKLGRGAVWQGLGEPCVHQNHVFVVRPEPLLSSSYLNSWISSSIARDYFLIAGKQTTNLASISKSSLGELPIHLPSLEEQEAIADILDTMDSAIRRLEERHTKTIALKQGMMQQLLTGKIRLK